MTTTIPLKRFFTLLRIAWLSLIVAAISLTAGAQQSNVTGTVTDAVSGEPLSFANIRPRNSTEGVYTDSTGAFIISIYGLEAILVVTTVGYKAKTIKVKPGQNNIAIAMYPLSVELREVMIRPPKKKKHTVDTAALYVLEKVQEHKAANNPKNIPNYYLHEHNKLIISLLNVPEKFINRGIVRPFKFFFEKRDTTESGKEFAPLLIQEEYNETYHRAKPALDNKVIYYRRISGMKKNFIANLVANQFKVIDIYENVYVITGKAFTSPFSPGARFTYSYHMLDTIRDESGVSYKINFVAKNKEDVALKGYAIVDSATWGIKYIHFRPNEKANVNFLTDYSVDQKFEKADTGWIMESEKINAIGNLLEKQKKLSVYLTKRTMRDSIQYDRAIPDSVNRSKDDIIAKDAFRKPASYMDSFRISPLDEAERHIYHSFDTAKTLRAYKNLSWVVNFFTSGNFKAGPVDFGRSYYMLSHNSVEGYRVRMGVFTNDLFSEKVYLYGHAAYGFLDQKWKYEGDAHFMLPTHSNRWHALTLTSKDDMIQLGQENPMLSSDNLLTLLSVRSRDTRVMHLRLESVTYERDWFKGLSSNIALSYKHFYTIPGVFNFEQTEPDGSVKDINGISTTEFMGELRYSKDDQYIESYSYRYFVPTTKPSFTFRYTWGIKNPLIGDYGYEKFQGIIKDIIYMPVIGYGKLNLTAGYIAGGVPYPLAFISSSNTSFLKDEFSFQLTNPFEFASDKYVSLWYEQHFEGLLFNHIPYIRLLKLREFIAFKALYGDFATSNQQLMSLPDGTHTAAKMPYMEVGFGLENIFKIIQVELVWRATYRYVTGAENFGVKIGIRPGF